MLYGFKVVPSLGTDSKPAQDYFTGIAVAASHALTHQAGEFAGAWAFCEYLDAVDSRAMPSNPGLYQRCLTGLLNFLDSASRSDAQALAAKSWAAKTCLELAAEAMGNVVRMRRA